MKMFVILIFLLTLSFQLSAQQNIESDFIGDITSKLPADWSVELESNRGKFLIKIKTSEMLLGPSMFGNASPDILKGRLTISMELAPRYSEKTFKQVQAFNEPFKEKLKKINYYSSEYREISAKLIDEPIFYNEVYGIIIHYPSRVPCEKNDTQMLSQFLKEISTTWVSYEQEKADGHQELLRIFTFSFSALIPPSTRTGPKL